MEKLDHSLSVRFQSMVEIEIVSILIGQRGNLREKNIVMATVEFTLDSSENKFVDLSGNQLLITSTVFKPIKIGLKITLVKFT